MLKTAAELAWLKTEPVDSRFAALQIGPCGSLHTPYGAPRFNVWRHTVSRMEVRLYEPGPNKVFAPGDGWIRPVDVIAAAGADWRRRLCLHRNGMTGDYWVFQEER